MDAFFLYHRTTGPTGRVLGNALGIPHGPTPPSDRRLDLLIRWGNSESIAYRPSLVLNPAGAIKAATNKQLTLELLSEAGVVVPKFSQDYYALDAPYLGRAVSHTRGTDIKFYLQHRDVEYLGESDYYVEYVPVHREYRLRVVGEECVRISEKVLTNPDAYTPWIRNYENGHTFVSPRTRCNEFQEALAIAAVRRLGLHFGAVDMVVGDDGNSYVLEVNTAPALAPMSAGAMLGGMVRYISERTEGAILLDPEYDLLAALTDTDDGDTEDDNDTLDF